MFYSSYFRKETPNRKMHDFQCLSMFRAGSLLLFSSKQSMTYLVTSIVIILYMKLA